MVSDAASGRRRGWGLLRHNPGFGLLWSGRTVSFAGDSLAHMALLLYVAHRSGGPAVAALLIVGDFAPSLFSPVLGSLGDRFDRRRLMITTQVLQAAAVLMLALWMPGLAGLLILVAINANLASAFQPASSSAVPQLVPESDLTRANSIIGFGTYGLAIVGPLGVAVLTPLVGLRGVLLVDALTFAVSVTLLWRLPDLPPTAPHPYPRAGETRQGIWRDVVTGLRYMWSNRIVRTTVLGFSALVACTALDDVALVFLAKDTLHASSSLTSLLYAGADAGLLIGFLALTRIRREAPHLFLVGGIALNSLGNLATGLSWIIALAITSQIVRGLGIAAQDAGGNTLLQRYVPTAMQSRVFANFYTAIGLAAGLSYLGGGFALTSASPRTVLAGAGAAGVLVAIVTGATLSRATRHPDVTHAADA
ncbi:MAG: MFS transporter [Mycobacteriales bacterium]